MRTKELIVVLSVVATVSWLSLRDCPLGPGSGSACSTRAAMFQPRAGQSPEPCQPSPQAAESEMVFAVTCVGGAKPAFELVFQAPERYRMTSLTLENKTMAGALVKPESLKRLGPDHWQFEESDLELRWIGSQASVVGPDRRGPKLDTRWEPPTGPRKRPTSLEPGEWTATATVAQRGEGGRKGCGVTLSSAPFIIPGN